MWAGWPKLLLAVKHPNPQEKTPKTNKPSDIDAKGRLQYFDQAWRRRKKKEFTFEPTHSNTQHASQSQNAGMSGVGVCQTDGMWFNVFEVGFTFKTYRIVSITDADFSLSDTFASDYGKCQVHLMDSNRAIQRKNYYSLFSTSIFTYMNTQWSLSFEGLIVRNAKCAWVKCIYCYLRAQLYYSASLL